MIDFGSFGTRVFLVMKYIVGKSLQEHLRRSSASDLNRDGAMAIAAWFPHLCRTVDKIHEAGYVHLDIKPSNILLGLAPRPWLCDLATAERCPTGGIDSVVAKRRGVSATHAAPEQLNDDPLATVGPWTDQYALASTLFLAMSGQRPFEVPFEKLIRPAPSLHSVQPGIPTTLSRVFERALARERARRYDSCTEFSAALLEAGLAGQRAQPLSTSGNGTAMSTALTDLPVFSEGRTNPFLDQSDDGIEDDFLPDDVRGSVAPRRAALCLNTGFLDREHAGFLDREHTGFLDRAVAPFRAIKRVVTGGSSQVWIGASLPGSVEPGQSFTLFFTAAVEKFAAEVEQAVLASSATSVPRWRLGRASWKRGTEVRLVAGGSDLEIEQPSLSFRWDGAYSIVPFDACVRADAAGGTSIARIDAYVEGFRVAMLRLEFEIRGTAIDAATATRVRPASTAFASYSSGDRKRVLDRVAALRTSAGMDVFMDCLSLNPGDDWKPRLRDEIRSRDLFLLFWSSAAAVSKWVRWEWQEALHSKGIEVIELHTLDTAEVAPPPQELATLHFSDPLMRLRASY